MSEAYNALGPGDPDPRSPAADVIAETPKPLGPGDDDPRSPANGTPIVTAGPLAPGDPNPGDVEDERIMLAPMAAGPGDAASTPRSITHVPRRKPTVVSVVQAEPASAVVAVEPEASAPAATHEEIL